MHGVARISDCLPFSLPLIIAIRFFDDLDRMKYLIGDKLIELHPAAEAICSEHFGVYALYLSYQPAPDPNGQMMELLFKTHNARITAAITSIDRF